MRLRQRFEENSAQMLAQKEYSPWLSHLLAQKNMAFVSLLEKNTDWMLIH